MFDCRTTEASEHSPTRILLLEGVVDDAETALRFEGILDSMLHEDRCPVVLDFSKVTYMSSAGWGVVIKNSKELMMGRLSMAGLSASVRDVFDLLGFSHFCVAYETTKEAIQAAELRNISVGEGSHGLAI